MLPQTVVMPRIEQHSGVVKMCIQCFSDNENSYTSQMVRTIKYFAEI